MVPEPASLPRRALALPRVPQLRTSLHLGGGLRCCHVSPGSGPHHSAQEGSNANMRPMALHGIWAMRIKKLSYNRHAARHTCFQDTLARYRGAYKMCEQTMLS
jgi:hypothetical protein